MAAKLIDGRKIADKHLLEVKDFISKNKIKPKLATVLVGGNPASVTYVNIKKKTCESVGIHVDIHRVDTEYKKIETLIKKLNEDRNVNGILVQLPLPNGIDTQRIIEIINPTKDVDGLHPINLGRLAYGDETMPACTPFGIVKILEDQNVELEGSNVVIIGRGVHVGKPLNALLCNRNATVTLCHTRTRNLEEITRKADIVVVAVGKPNFLKAGMIKEGSVIIDVGINKADKKITGDADASVVKKASLVTPVPGGVGPMTVAMLAKNTLNACRRQNQ